MNVGKSWTEEEIETLKQGILAGWSGVKIGNVLGRTRDACWNKAYRLGMSCPDALLRPPQGKGEAPEIWNPNSPRCRPTVPRVRCLEKVESDKWAMR